MMPAHFDEQWAEFREICRTRDILPGGSFDWMWAAHAWQGLSTEQRLQAIEDAGKRDAEDYTVARSLPQNYLKGRYFERPHRKPAAAVAASKGDERLRNA